MYLVARPKVARDEADGLTYIRPMTESDRLGKRILWGLVIGVVAALATLGMGWLYPPVPRVMREISTAVFDPFGQVFLRMLFFVVIPLVFASLASGVAQLGRLEKLRPLAGRTFLLFALNMLIAVAIGLVMMNTVQPGHHLGEASRAELMQEFAGSAKQTIATSAEQPRMSLATLVDMFMPRNLLGAVVGSSRSMLGDVLPLIVFAILIGAAATQLPDRRRRRVQAALDTVTELMTRIVGFALQLAPYAVPAMIYSVIVKVGLDVLLALAVFVVACMAAMVLHLFGTMSWWIRFLAKRSPRVFFRQIQSLLVTAFSTSSSSACLPASLAVAHDPLRINPSTAGFVLPLGATMNMSGTALFEGCVVLFVAQTFGVDLSFGSQLMLMLLSVLSAVAVAGIPGGSLPMIAALLTTFGVPVEGIGLIIGVDRILDMSRTTVNVGSDIAVAAAVDYQLHSSTGSE